MVVAVDWSGAVHGAAKRIWLARMAEGHAVQLENGRDREALASYLVQLAAQHPRLVVGLDFAFSFPAWFLRERGLASGHALWALAATEGERWLRECRPPFWGRPPQLTRDHPHHGEAPCWRCFRATDLAVPPVGGIRPKSAFQVSGAGQVGTGAVRGMPILQRLAHSGFAIWPFNPPRWPLVVEVYPRLLTGPVNKTQQADRDACLARFSDLPAVYRAAAARDDNAFDACIAALEMARLGLSPERLRWPVDDEARLEGLIWDPQG